MSGCERRYHDCDDAVLDRLNGVDNIQPIGRRNGNADLLEEDARFLSDPCGGRRNGGTDLLEEDARFLSDSCGGRRNGRSADLLEEDARVLSDSGGGRRNGLSDQRGGKRHGRSAGRREEDSRVLSDPCGSGWADACSSRNRQRSCCDFCWLWSRCPYREGNRNRE